MLKTGPRPGEALDSPVAWFVVLERARQDRDYARAAQALQELDRLGVRVKYRRQPRQVSGGQAHA